MRYRRYYRAGGTYFFTVVAHNRQPILTGDSVRSALREAVLAVRGKYPFEIAAWVLMPDHLHTIWHLPENYADFSERWRQIKQHSQYLIGADMRLWQQVWIEAQRKVHLAKPDCFHHCWVRICSLMAIKNAPESCLLAQLWGQFNVFR